MAAASSWPDNPFWDFSVRVYGRGDVAAACLALQERLGADVNILLYCAWLGLAHNRQLTDGEIAKISAAVADWHMAVVRPLRSLRQRLKADRAGAPPDTAERVRDRIKGTELDAERAEQLMLYRMGFGASAGSAGAVSTARGNARAYLDTLGNGMSAADEADIEAILSGGAVT